MSSLKNFNSMEQVSHPLTFTRQAILLLNSGLVTSEQARALYNVDDLSTFKTLLVDENIFVWNEVDGPVRIHGGDYLITIVIKQRQKSYVVEGTKPFENVISVIEADLRLSRGYYKLTTSFHQVGMLMFG